MTPEATDHNDRHTDDFYLPLPALIFQRLCTLFENVFLMWWKNFELISFTEVIPVRNDIVFPILDRCVN